MTISRVDGDNVTGFLGSGNATPFSGKKDGEKLDFSVNFGSLRFEYKCTFNNGEVAGGFNTDDAYDLAGRFTARRQ